MFFTEIGTPNGGVSEDDSPSITMDLTPIRAATAGGNERQTRPRPFDAKVESIFAASLFLAIDRQANSFIDTLSSFAR